MKNIESLFDSISNRYDRFNHVTSLGIDRCWRRQAVRSLPQCGHVLDVAVGTADFSIELLRQDKAQHVTGIDLSSGMMAVGHAKLERLHLADKVVLQQADCARLPFADGTFDAVTCGYGVRNFDQLDQSLSEMYRVLKPGGELRILEFGYPQSGPIRWAFNIYFSYIMPVIGRMMTGNAGAFRYFLSSVKGFAKGEAFVEHLSHAGFQKCTFRNQTFGISILYSARKQ